MINKVIIMGRMIRAPELRYTGSGKSVCSFAVAVDNGYGENKQTDFISCVAWNKTAEFVSKYFDKGRMIIVIGRIANRTYEDKYGKKNYVTEVIVSEVNFGERKEELPCSGEPMCLPEEPCRQTDKFTLLLDDDTDLPF